MPRGFPFTLQSHQVLAEMSDKYVNLTPEEADIEFAAIEWDWAKATSLMQEAYQLGARDASALLAVSYG